MRNKPYFDMTSGPTRTGFYHANVYVGMVWLIYLESNVSEAVVSDLVIQSNVYKHTRILRIMGYNEVNLKFFSFMISACTLIRNIGYNEHIFVSGATLL